jgi:hypothetical protein
MNTVKPPACEKKQQINVFVASGYAHTGLQSPILPHVAGLLCVFREGKSIAITRFFKNTMISNAYCLFTSAFTKLAAGLSPKLGLCLDAHHPHPNSICKPLNLLGITKIQAPIQGFSARTLLYKTGFTALIHPKHLHLSSPTAAVAFNGARQFVWLWQNIASKCDLFLSLALVKPLAGALERLYSLQRNIFWMQNSSARPINLIQGRI